MSGTSIDGIDAVLADFAGANSALLGAVFVPFPPSLRRALLDLQASGTDELARAAGAANSLADAYADAILTVIGNASVSASDVVAAGVHGQTVRHRPNEGWTLQLNNPARVAERTGITVVADFRSRDIAAGGQGAPLVPAFHAATFTHAHVHRVLVNIGGIANITDLPPGDSAGIVRGFDVGPGNVLMDLWTETRRGEAFDRDGAWARSGRIDAKLLALLNDEPFFQRPPPRSTGRDLFNREWLAAKLARWSGAGRLLPGHNDGGQAMPPIDEGGAADVQATLLAFTAHAIADAIGRYCDGAAEVLVCGGGARNTTLMDVLARAMPTRNVTTTATYGVAVEHVEALAFAWLARETVSRRPGNLPAVTGAKGPRVLGAIYPR